MRRGSHGISISWYQYLLVSVSLDAKFALEIDTCKVCRCSPKRVSALHKICTTMIALLVNFPVSSARLAFPGGLSSDAQIAKL